MPDPTGYIHVRYNNVGVVLSNKFIEGPLDSTADYLKGGRTGRKGAREPKGKGTGKGKASDGKGKMAEKGKGA